MLVFMSSFKLQTIIAIVNWLLCNESLDKHVGAVLIPCLPITTHNGYHAKYYNSTYIGTGLNRIKKAAIN